MSRTAKEYLTYLVGLAGVLAVSNANANAKQGDVSKILDKAKDWTTIAMRYWYYEAFPDATYVKHVLRSHKPRKHQPGQMKKKLEIIRNVVKT